MEVTKVKSKPYSSIEKNDFLNALVLSNLALIENYWIRKSTWGTETTLNVSFVYTDATADAASCSKLAAFELIREENTPKILMHVKHCLSNTKAIPIQIAQSLLHVDAAACDA